MAETGRKLTEDQKGAVLRELARLDRLGRLKPDGWTSPEQQISNVIAGLGETAERKHSPGQLDELRAIARQLADLWPRYLAGELPEVTDETPF
jgi:hypothetical protein